MDHKIISWEDWKNLGGKKPKPRIRHVGGNFYLVESRTTIGTLYRVDTLNLRCDCQAGQHFKRCWHLVYALQYEDWRRKEEQKWLDRSPI